MTLEMKRIAPGETNTWYFHAVGTRGGVRYSTKEPKTLWTFTGRDDQAWQRQDLGFRSCFPTITGAIFEPGFPDSLLQMLAAFAWERSGCAELPFGCATPDEALASHELFASALVSHRDGSVAPVGPADSGTAGAAGNSLGAAADAAAWAKAG